MIGRPQVFRSQHRPERLRARVAETTDPVWNLLGRRPVRGLWLGGWLILTPAPDGSRHPRAWLALKVDKDAGGSRLKGVFLANPLGRGLVVVWTLMLGAALAFRAAQAALSGGIDPVNLTVGGVGLGVTGLMFWVLRPREALDDIGRLALVAYLAETVAVRPEARR